MTNLCIELINEQDLIDFDMAEVETVSYRLLTTIFEDQEIIAKSVFQNINTKQKEIYLDVLICDDKKIHQLNNQYRHKDKATDVLTFALFSDSPSIAFAYDNNISLGSIVLSLEYIQKQAKEYNKSFKEEFYFLLCHGFLHLLGFCHDDEKSLKFMIDLQNKLVQELNLKL